MIDREKVIKGLECCTQHGSMGGRNCNGHWGYTDASHTRMELIGEYRAGCTYGSCETGCVKTLAKDALALLKAQEPIEARLNLCESCAKEYAECEADKTDLVYGSGVGNDNIIGCSWYVNRWKAQEPRVLTLDEVAALPDGSIVWLEDNDKPDVIVGLLRDVLLTANDHIVVVIHFATVRNQLLEVVTAMADDYGIRWRCWTSRPTDEQRKVVMWE